MKSDWFSAEANAYAFGERKDVFDAVLLGRFRKTLVGWHRELLDHPQERRIVADVVLVKKQPGFHLGVGTALREAGSREQIEDLFVHIDPVVAPTGMRHGL